MRDVYLEQSIGFRFFHMPYWNRGHNGKVNQTNSCNKKNKFGTWCKKGKYNPWGHNTIQSSLNSRKSLSKTGPRKPSIVIQNFLPLVRVKNMTRRFTLSPIMLLLTIEHWTNPSSLSPSYSTMLKSSPTIHLHMEEKPPSKPGYEYVWN